jgi:hypothetical protein
MPALTIRTRHAQRIALRKAAESAERAIGWRHSAYWHPDPRPMVRARRALAGAKVLLRLRCEDVDLYLPPNKRRPLRNTIERLTLAILAYAEPYSG